MKHFIALCLGLWAALLSLPARAQDGAPVLIFADTSLTDVLTAQARAWFKTQNQPMPTFTFGASGAIAAQIMEGEPADLMFGANPSWLFTLSDQGLLQGEPVSLVKNNLVFVIPGVSQPSTPGRYITPQMIQQYVRGGRLAISDPQTGPAGAYARDYLVAAGLWRELEPKLSLNPDVRRTLVMIERSGLPGFVYYTDALASKYITIIGTVPEDPANPILYMAGLMSSASPEAHAFLTYLTSAGAQEIWVKFGFQPFAAPK